MLSPSLADEFPLFSDEYFVDDPVVHSFSRDHISVAIKVFGDTLDRLAGILRKQLAGELLFAQQFPRMNVYIRCVAGDAPNAGWVHMNCRMWQTIPFTFGPTSQDNRRHARR